MECVRQMPTGSEEEGDLVFLSPDESPPKDQGASPQLRRSSRKRKSVQVVQDMSKGSSSKKKKAVRIRISKTPQTVQACPR